MPAIKGWAIIQKARFGSSKGIEYLALVDQKLNQDFWWTSDDPDMIMLFHKKDVAEKVASRFENNDAQVLLFSEAHKIIREQMEAMQ